VGEHKRSGCAGGRIKRFVQLEGVLIHDLVFNLPPGQVLQVVPLAEVGAHLVFHPPKINHHFRGLHFEAGQGAVILQMREGVHMVDLKGGIQVLFLDLFAAGGVEVRDGEQMNGDHQQSE